MKYVIIGNSAAAIGCVEAIRKNDTKGSITIISSEKYHTYSRPLISYLLWGKTTLENMKYRDYDFYEKNNCNCIFKTDAVKILKEEKIVILSNGDKISYDKLLIATGSRPLVPPIKGLESVSKKFTFMTLDDAKSLEKELAEDKKVLIMGAGLIGLKCMEGIKHLVKEITVVDMADRILPSILEKNGSEMVQSYLENQGVKFILSDSVEKFEGNTAILKSGKKIDFDILIVAVGVRPNVSLAEDIGAKTEKGIVINDKCQTTVDDVFAAGDCTVSYDISSDSNKILALLPNAYMQGECAGNNMSGNDSVFDKAMPMNAIGLLGLHIITAGSYEGKSYVKKTENSLKILYVKDNLLKGYIMIGDIKRAGIYTSLIREKTPLDTIDFDLIFEAPQLMAFSSSERGKKLAGAK